MMDNCEAKGCAQPAEMWFTWVVPSKGRVCPETTSPKLCGCCAATFHEQLTKYPNALETLTIHEVF